MKHFSDEDIKFLQTYYPSNGIKYCAEKLHRTTKSIKNKVSKLKIKINQDTRADNIKNNLSIYFNQRDKKQDNFLVNANNFINGQKNKIIAYLCGLLWADGYIYNNMISLQVCRDDGEIFLPIFQFSGQWQYYYRKQPNRKHQIMIATSNKSLSDFLISLGHISYRKDMSRSVDFFDTDVQSHWWRGYFDGDGCFYVSSNNLIKRASCSASIDYNWQSLQKLFNRLNIKFNCYKYTNNKNHQYSSININKKKDIQIFGDYIYKDSKDIRLERKYNKFLDCIKRGIKN